MKCSICGSLPAWCVDKDDKGTYWLCGKCATEQVMETFLEKQILLRVARALQDVRIYFANSEILSDVDVFQHPYFKDGMRYAYKALKEAERLL